jgi:hypothetical protein
VISAVHTIAPAWDTPIEQIDENDHIRFYQEIINFPELEVLLKPPCEEHADAVREFFLEAQHGFKNPQPTRSLHYQIMDRNEYRMRWAAAWLDCAGVVVSEEEIADYAPPY